MCIPEARCKKCGKIFVPAPEHVFTDKSGSYCSWTCWGHRKEKKKPNPKTKPIVRKKVEQYSLDGKLLFTYQNVDIAAERIDGTINNIRTACRKGTVYKKFLWKYKNQ